MAARMFDVFARVKAGGPVRQVGQLTAADVEFARLHATQLFCRRGETRELAVAEREALSPTEVYGRVLEHHHWVASRDGNGESPAGR